MQNNSEKLKTIFFFGIIFLLFPAFALATSSRENTSFFVADEFDIEQRVEVNALLIKTSPKLYFYIDNEWWDKQDVEQQEEIIDALNFLDEEFRNKIYPVLTSTFGYERRPGIDKDERITILIHPILERVGGYFSPADGFPRIQAPISNEREMIYLNAKYIKSEIMKPIIAHEFVHLITFNQKNITHNVSEEIWLNDVRAEFAATLLGYNDVFRGSSLERRMRIVSNNPFDSLTEWQEELADYGVVNLFAHYLVDHYGIEILVDSLHSEKVGIPSINYALAKNGFEQDFSQIFTNFKIAVLVNDCELGEKFCFLHPHLQDFRITPRLNFLPFIGESVLQLVDTTTHWSGNWHKIIGGKRVLTLEFDGDDRAGFKVAYLICDHQENCNVNFLELDENQQGEITIVGFNEKYASLTIMPSIQSKLIGFNGIERRYLFNWRASAAEKTEAEIEAEKERQAELERIAEEKREVELRKQLLEQIETLKNTIAELEVQISIIREQRVAKMKIHNNLFFGMRNSTEVQRLQKFLKAQGSEIYPEGLVTGNFFNLTKAAVIRFQNRHKAEILTPIGLERGTGFVGPKTRAKINNILKLEL
jgi:hypothetical protein